MAVDMFLKLTDITGESQDANHGDEIELLAFSWGMSQSGTMHSGTGGGAGKVSVQDLSFTHYVDKASADLLNVCATGKHIDEGILTVRKAGGADALEYIVITMTDIIVTSVSSGGSGGEDRLTESVSLNFASFNYEYKPQTAEGSAAAASSFAYDIAANKAA